jgi:hypothetical protein
LAIPLVRGSADHNVCCICQASKELIATYQLSAADLRREGDDTGATLAWEQMVAEEAKLDKHLQQVTPRRDAST